jgi:hypothetical protein
MTERHDHPHAGAMPAREARSDALDVLTEAMVSYLDEVNDARAVCMRHERTASAYADRGIMHLIRTFPWAEEAADRVRDAAERLPRWGRSPLRDAGLGGRGCKKADGRPAGSGRPIFSRGVAFEGRPVLVCISRMDGGQVLGLELLLPRILLGLPELSLRQAASGLLCHEYLLAEAVAAALPAATLAEARFLPLLEYLRRTTPRSLYASQCFLSPGTGP